MAVNLRKGIRSLIRTTGASDNPPAGQRALLAKTDGWYDRTPAGVEAKVSFAEVYDGAGTTFSDTYLRFIRDGDGHVQQIILGTVT